MPQTYSGEGVVPRNGRRPLRAATTERYRIWTLQIAAGREPCFGTPLRLVCKDTGCPWWDECQTLTASWLR